MLGFPCNQFGGQEPGSAEEIAEFCSTTYGVTFPMTEKIDVNGAERHPIYAALRGRRRRRHGDIRWNFEKFLVGADGTVAGRGPGVTTEPRRCSPPSRRTSPPTTTSAQPYCFMVVSG